MKAVFTLHFDDDAEVAHLLGYLLEQCVANVPYDILENGDDTDDDEEAETKA